VKSAEIVKVVGSIGWNGSSEDARQLSTNGFVPVLIGYTAPVHAFSHISQVYVNPDLLIADRVYFFPYAGGTTTGGGSTGSLPEQDTPVVIDDEVHDVLTPPT